MCIYLQVHIILATLAASDVCEAESVASTDNTAEIVGGVVVAVAFMIITALTVIVPSARMRSEGYCSRPVCVCVCPGLASATHATTRPSRHTYGLSIVLAPEFIWRFSKIAIALPYLRTHGSRPFLYEKRAHFPHSFRILRS